MSTLVFPALRGLTYPGARKTIFKSTKPQSISGKVTSISRWSIPLYQWSPQWSLLRQGKLSLTTWTEYAQLESFFEQLLGGYDSFLYQDPDDNAVANQALGTGNGTKTLFPLVRTFGSASIPVLAPNLSIAPVIKVNGSVVTDYTITPWDTTDTNGSGMIEFSSAPGGSAPVTGSFSYYFPCRWDNDEMNFQLFLQGMYSLEKTSFTSIK